MKKTNDGKICNCCGEKIDVLERPNGLRVRRKLSYGSVYDGDDLCLTLCCSCLDRMIESCMISPVAGPKIYKARVKNRTFGRVLTDDLA